MKPKETDWETEIIYRGRPLSDYANHIREQCARECERLEARGYERGAVIIMAAAIRALKVSRMDRDDAIDWHLMAHKWEARCARAEAEVERLQCDLDAMERKRNIASVNLVKATEENESTVASLKILWGILDQPLPEWRIIQDARNEVQRAIRALKDKR